MRLQDVWEKQSHASEYETLRREAMSEVTLSAQDGLSHARIFFEHSSLGSRVYKKDYRDFPHVVSKKESIRAEWDRVENTQNNLQAELGRVEVT